MVFGGGHGLSLSLYRLYSRFFRLLFAFVYSVLRTDSGFPAGAACRFLAGTGSHGSRRFAGTACSGLCRTRSRRTACSGLCRTRSCRAACSGLRRTGLC